MSEAQRILAVVALAGVGTSAFAQAETGLVGIRLFDPNTKVLAKFGNPDEILPVVLGGGATFGGGGQGQGQGQGGAPAFGGPGFGAPGAGAPPFGGPGRGGAAAPSLDASFTPLVGAEEFLRQFAPPRPSQGSGGGGQFGAPADLAPPGAPGAGAGAPPFGGAPGGRGGAPAAAGAGTRVTFTRWVYNRKNAKYGFIIDRQGRVVQVESIGLRDASTKTSQGTSFGSDFKSIIKKYGNPDGYEISGDTMFLKYLTRRKVAFRLARLAPKRPQVVVGIVVAAGKG